MGFVHDAPAEGVSSASLCNESEALNDSAGVSGTRLYVMMIMCESR